MYLKSIEVHGFKSFANKILFEFHNGITAIVGPNGSGKSNVADAVRWVLGEQSAKQLRGAKMEDVIFSGTQNRKPQGFAYVALTIDNFDHQLAIDYDTVTVSRRVYRSGESEYQINGAICRLKDLHELFYDTGIGKEGYSIIGQGQIEQILSGKPEEKRELFDEAAGIVKFKRRKNEALKKLDAEKQNLVRVQDILSELEKQVEPLKKQAEIAKDYLRLKESLKIQESSAFVAESKSLKAQIQEIEKKYEISDNQLLQSKEKQEQVRKEYENLSVQIRETQDESEQKKASVLSIQLNVEKQESEIRLLEEQIHSIHKQNQTIALRIDTLSAQQQERQQEKKAYEKEKKAAEQVVNDSVERRKHAEAAAARMTNEIQENVKQAEEYRSQIFSLLNEKSTIKTNIQRYETIEEQIQLRKTELNRKIQQFNQEQASQEESIKTYKKELKDILEEISLQEEEKKRLDQQIFKRSKENETLEKKRNDFQQQFHMERSKLESLRNLTERYDGYSNSIRKIMERRTEEKGIIGVVADIIKAEKKYETAIETALGGSIQNIVTDTEHTAKKLIQYLKKNQFGRATFLPLDGITSRNHFSNEKVLQEAGVIGIASELVKFEKKYENVANNLLGKILVVDHIDHALQIARKFQYTLRIVTLEGELLNVGGSMTGGSFKNNSNLLGRRREIEDLEQNVILLEQDLAQIKKKIEAGHSENKKNREQLEHSKLLLQKQYLLQNTANFNLKQAEDEKNLKETQYQGYLKEEKEIQLQLSEICQELKEFHDKLSQNEEKNKEFEEKILQLNEKRSVLQEQETQKNRFTEHLRMESSAAMQKVAFLSENFKRVQQELQKIEAETTSLAQEKQEAAAQIQQKEQKIEEIRKRIEKFRKQSQIQEQELKKWKEKAESLLKKQQSNLKIRDELSEQILLLEKENFRFNSQKEKLQESLLTLVNYMWNEYEITQSEAQNYSHENKLRLSELKRQIYLLKTQIRELGAVNVNAIEDFKEISKRYTFLKAQHQDLVEAEQTLLKIIEELDTGMRTQFTEKFQEIRLEFAKVFRELFGGGNGTIELTEDEDILEAGIRIISQPPGKKLQNMMQLSGGEKALTAIALLFAIQNLKPSPFCLLDEIEAALDDSNVGRYADYLHKLTEYTQFIVITHRKGTMAAADRLYGITMQEKGVSTLVSVDFVQSELEKTENKGEKTNG